MVAGHLHDLRLLTTRRKTIRELNPVALWDANFGIGVADGVAVTNWVDVIGGVTLTQASTDLKPVFLANGLGDGPCVLFDTNDYLAVSGSPVLNSAAFTVAAVVQLTNASPGAAQVLLSVSDSSETDRYMHVGYTDGGEPRFVHRNDTAISAAAGGNSVSTDRHVIVFSNNSAGDAWACRLNRVAQTLTPIGAYDDSGEGFDITDADILAVGCGYSSGAGFQMYAKVAYVAVWNSRL